MCCPSHRPVYHQIQTTYACSTPVVNSLCMPTSQSQSSLANIDYLFFSYSILLCMYLFALKKKHSNHMTQRLPAV
ncbi:hypothetical protein DM02DRAFT_614363 [Periconia macrospinosa]|uniref:Uncharacterized protein n=1 Tax=Periconia macrospinosa TaxID=97972 RepID=A0A2V1DQM3_9PLEO|nr:hypothetical protein DM02DRAFT_614363 [Periconia macrospinosa]